MRAAFCFVKIPLMHPKISVNVLGFKHKQHLEECFKHILAQDYPSFELTFIDNNSGDGSEEFTRQNFPQIKVIQTGGNFGYSGGHNIGLQKTDGEFVVFVNPDLKMKPNFLSEAVKPMLNDSTIAGVQGKLIRPELVNGKYIFDGAGIVITKSRKTFDRGQWEEDNGQHNTPEEVFAINGSAPVYRRSALLDAAIGDEILDNDLFAYYDDSDLCWRLRRLGWKLWYQPMAVAFHERAMGRSPKSIFKDPKAFINFHKSFSTFTRRLSWKNNILLLIKNDFGAPFWRDLPRIVIRQLAVFFFILIFERDTLAVWPQFRSQIPKMLKKRSYLKIHGRVSPSEIGKWFK